MTCSRATERSSLGGGYSKCGRTSNELTTGLLGCCWRQAMLEGPKGGDSGITVAPKFANLYIVKADALEKQAEMYSARSALKQGAATVTDGAFFHVLRAPRNFCGLAASAYSRLPKLSKCLRRSACKLWSEDLLYRCAMVISRMPNRLPGCLNRPGTSSSKDCWAARGRLKAARSYPGARRVSLCRSCSGARSAGKVLRSILPDDS